MPQKQETAVETRRLTAPEIFDAAADQGRSELKRSSRSLAFSGLAGGITIGLSGIGVAAIHATLGDGSWQQFVSYLMYPAGFIAVIIGRSQLFTENTLYPVVLVLDEKRHLAAMLRLWGVVLTANILGALLFAALAIRTPALRPDIAGASIRRRGALSTSSGAVSSAAGSLPWWHGWLPPVTGRSGKW